jgi:hypothetical protein
MEEPKKQWTPFLLPPLETFDTRAFVAGDGCSQDLCNLVLACAVVYNDFRDISIALDALSDAAPKGTKGKTPVWGELGGMECHLIRLGLALIHELLKLLARSSAVLQEPGFRELRRHLSKSARAAWDELVNAANETAPDSQLTRILLFFRNKVAYHYDAKEIARGFRERFSGGDADVPLVSRGGNLLRTRFFFADATVQEYLKYRSAGDDEALSLLDWSSPLYRQIHLALFQIVTKYFPLRRLAWRPYSPLSSTEPA